MRTLPAFLLSLAITACAKPRPPAPTLTLAPTADTVIVPVVEVTRAVPRSDGKWTVLALLEDQLYLADFRSRSAVPFPGITKTDVPHPITLFGAGDTIF